MYSRNWCECGYFEYIAFEEIYYMIYEICMCVETNLRDGMFAVDFQVDSSVKQLIRHVFISRVNNIFVFFVFFGCYFLGRWMGLIVGFGWKLMKLNLVLKLIIDLIFEAFSGNFRNV